MTASLFKPVMNTASHAQHGAALTISYDFSGTPELLCRISVHFCSFFTAFLASRYLYSDTCDNSSHFRIIVARVDCAE